MRIAVEPPVPDCGFRAPARLVVLAFHHVTKASLMAMFMSASVLAFSGNELPCSIATWLAIGIPYSYRRGHIIEVRYIG